MYVSAGDGDEPSGRCRRVRVPHKGSQDKSVRLWDDEWERKDISSYKSEMCQGALTRLCIFVKHQAGVLYKQWVYEKSTPEAIAVKEQDSTLLFPSEVQHHTRRKENRNTQVKYKWVNSTSLTGCTQGQSIISKPHCIVHTGLFIAAHAKSGLVYLEMQLFFLFKGLFSNSGKRISYCSFSE